jgi:hypothetical protein
LAIQFYGGYSNGELYKFKDLLMVSSPKNFC